MTATWISALGLVLSATLVAMTTLALFDDGPFAAVPAPFNMAKHTFAAAGRRPDKVALEVLTAPGVVAERWTHGTLAEAVRRTAGGLKAL